MANHVIQTPQGQTPSYHVEHPWYMDTGASEHITNEVNKLSMKEPYQGTDRVHTANGSGMRIHHVGHATIPTSSSRSLQLRNVLHVPSVKINLLYVPRFTYVNHVLVEFHPYIFFC